MPYDITLNVKNSGKLDVVYVVQGARTNTSLTQAELEKIAGAGSIRDYQATVYESQGSDGPERTIQVSRDDAPLPQEPPAPARYASIPEEFRPKAA